MDHRPKPQVGSKGGKKSFTPTGKHRKQTKKIVKYIEGLGFVFLSQKNHIIFKHPDRNCRITFATTPSDRNYIAGCVRRIRKVLKNCDPPFDIDKMPAEINKMRMVGIGEMNEEQTMGDVLDSYITDYEKVSTEMTTDGKKHLKILSEEKGITMGEMIEEMMDVYEKTQ